jgi:glycosyltransferase involved in cell wall biosynthesis
MTYPKISIVTPSFNQAKYLEQTICSVLDQGYPNLEYIVIDGGSTDGSVEIIKKYADRLTYWVSEKDHGQSHAINKGFSRGTGKIFAWINSDDYFYLGALDTAARAFAAHPESSMVTGIADCLDGDDLYRVQVAPVVTHESYAERKVGIAQPSTFFKADLFRAVGGLDESLHYVMDLDLWLKMLARTACVSIPKALSVCAIHAEMKSRDAKNRSLRYIESDIAYARGGSRCMRKELEQVLRIARLTGRSFASPEKLYADFSRDPRATIERLRPAMDIYAGMHDIKQFLMQAVSPKRKTKIAMIVDASVDQVVIKKVFADASAKVLFFGAADVSQSMLDRFDYVVSFVNDVVLDSEERFISLGSAIGIERNVARQCACLAEKMRDWRNYAPISRAREYARIKAAGRHD